jgi:hypothetical protein
MNPAFSPSWWELLLPPIWFSAPFELLLRNHRDPYLIILSIFALAVPIISFIIYHRMMPAFERNLQKLANNSGNSKRKDREWKNWLGRILCKSKEEKAFFRFSNNMMRNEREFRLKVYPSLGLSLVFPFIFMFNELQMNSYAHLVSSKWFLSVYMCNLVIPNAVTMLKYSGKYKGGWIYKTVPLNNLAPLYSATLKVFIVNLFLPIYFILSAIFLGIFGIKIVPDLLVVLVSSILYTVICSNALKEALPFSESFEDAQQNSGLKVILSILLIGIFVGLHFIITFFMYGVLIYLILMILVTILAWRRAYKTIWNY